MFDDPSRSPFAVLLVGTRQVQWPFPIGVCPLLTDAIAAAPFAAAPSGTTVLSVRPPEPGLFTVQAVGFGGAVLAASNGLQL